MRRTDQGHGCKFLAGRRWAQPTLRGWLTLAVVIAACGRHVAGAADPPPAKITPEQIERLVRELDADSFAAREEATGRLISAGPAAVAPVYTSVSNGSAESAMRGMFVLKELALSGEPDSEEAAREALEKITQFKAGSLARRATATLAQLDSLRQERALAQLERLGAKVSVTSTQIGVQIVQNMQVVEIGEGWQGEEKDLRWLRWLQEVDQIVFRRVKINEQALANVVGLKRLKVLEVKYVPLTDAALEHLKELKSVLAIRLYGTAVSKEGAEKLQAALAAAKIDFRQGGFLGVGGQAHPRGFAVTIVHPNSAADKMDMRVDDVIIKYEDKPIADFDALTVEISKNKPGDVITLEVLRNEEILIKKLTLGEWDERAKP